MNRIIDLFIVLFSLYRPICQVSVQTLNLPDLSSVDIYDIAFSSYSLKSIMNYIEILDYLFSALNNNQQNYILYNEFGSDLSKYNFTNFNSPVDVQNTIVVKYCGDLINKYGSFDTSCYYDDIDNIGFYLYFKGLII
jgi:hypothetical protein